MTMCDIPYSKQAKIIAIIEIVTSTFGLLTLVIATLLTLLSPSLRENIYHQDPHNIFNILIHFPTSEKVPMILVSVLYFVGELCLAVLLLKSVKEKNYARCRIWYIVTFTVCLTGAYFFIPGVIFTDESYHFIIIFVVSYFFTAYSVWVVHCFMKELKTEGLHSRLNDEWEDGRDKF